MVLRHLLLLGGCASGVVWSLKSIPRTQPNLFEGQIRIGSELYTLACTCSNQRKSSEGIPPIDLRVRLCAPRHGVVHTERTGVMGLGTADVEQHYGEARQFAFGELNTSTFGCSDDRANHASINTLGGEFGEWLLALSVYASFQSAGDQIMPLTRETVSTLLADYLELLPEQRNLNFCTDDDALDHLAKELAIPALALEALKQDLQDPALKNLKHSRNLGDFHLKQIAQSPEDYHVPGDLLGYALESFFKTLWDKRVPNREKLSLEISSGISAPQAVIDVRESDACLSEGLGAMFQAKTPVLGGKFIQAITINSKAAAYRRNELAEFLSQKLSSAGVRIESIAERILARGEEWTETSIRKMNLQLPIFSLTMED